MNLRKKAKRYKALYEMVTKKPVQVRVQTDTKPTKTLKATMLVSPKEMEAGIPFKTLLARKFLESIEEYMTVTSERDEVTTLYQGGSLVNNYIRLTGTIEIVGRCNQQ